MATSAIFTKSVGKIIEEALRDARIIPVEQPVQAIDYQRGIDALNNITTHWQTQDINLWLKAEAVLPLITGRRKYALGPDGDECADADTFVSTTLTADYAAADTTLTVSSTSGMSAGGFIGVMLDSGTRVWGEIGTVDSATAVTLVAALGGAAASGKSVYSYTTQIQRPMRILQARYAPSASSSETPVNRWARSQYFDQPDKDSTGTVCNWYYSPQLTEGELYVWQTASTDDNLLRFTYIRPALVYTATTDLLDFPSEFFIPLKWKIASEIGPSYGIPDNRQLVLEGKAESTLQAALGHDVEMDSMLIQPDFR